MGAAVEEGALLAIEWVTDVGRLVGDHRSRTPDVDHQLTERAVLQLMQQLVDQLRTREIPSRFDVALAWDGEALAIDVQSRRRLRSLEVRAGETVLRAWAEREAGSLIDQAASQPELRVYRTRIEIPAGTTGLIRVIASDEGGGREVRSIPMGEK